MPMGRKRKAYQKIPTSTESFGYALRLARVQKGWSMAEAAAKAGVTSTRLECIENQIVKITDSELTRLHGLFPVELAYWRRPPNS
jgi:transcriptional regulator with XRE-family HTH domain